MQQRKFDRFGFRAEALVTHNNVQFKGEVSDLSLKGLFVKTDQLLAVDDAVDVAIRFEGADEKFSFSIPATVVRTSDLGVGLSFRRIDIDSLLCEKKNSTVSGNGPDEFARFVEG